MTKLIGWLVFFGIVYAAGYASGEFLDSVGLYPEWLRP